jgi:Chaperone of endosialidase
MAIGARTLVQSTRRSRAAVLIAGLAGIAQGAYAQQPPDIVESDAYANTASGYNALVSLQVGGPQYEGTNNAAFGFSALLDNTTGAFNVAVGASALISNQTGNSDLAIGYLALGGNRSGDNNIAVGLEALVVNNIGNNNVAVGVQSLWENTAGSNNTAVGYQALFDNGLNNASPAANNTAIGYQALLYNVSGQNNVGQGVYALYSNGDGSGNVGLGNNALYENVSGSNNIALGSDAGYAVRNGSNNIEIGTPGTAADSATIRIGVQGTQMRTTIAGIYGTQVTGSAVYVTSTGQLGVQGSSERFKTDVAPMPELSARLRQLRPVTFHYKTDPNGVQQYGLIAEEVDKVYPELVIRNDKGEIQGVHYEELAPMLLKEIQQQARRIDAQDASNAEQAKTITEQAAEIRELKQQVSKVNDMATRLDAVLQLLRAKEELVARR